MNYTEVKPKPHPLRREESSFRQVLADIASILNPFPPELPEITAAEALATDLQKVAGDAWRALDATQVALKASHSELTRQLDAASMALEHSQQLNDLLKELTLESSLRALALHESSGLEHLKEEILQLCLEVLKEDIFTEKMREILREESFGDIEEGAA